jgi:hypothetical protein
MLLVMITVFAMLQIQVMHVYELVRRRQVVAAFFGEVQNVVHEGLTQSQFDQLLLNPGLKRFQVNETDLEVG